MIVADHLLRPTRESGGGPPLCPRRGRSLLGLAPGGGCLAGPVTSAAGGLLPHLFTLTPGMPEAYCFCGPLPRIAPPGCYPAPRPMEFGLSSNGSKPSAAARSPWTSASS